MRSLALACFCAALCGLGLAGERAATARIEVPAKPVWAGEVFDLALDVRVDKATFRNVAGTPLWDAGALVATPWSAFTAIDSADSSTLRFAASALVLHPGNVTVMPATQAVVLQTGVQKMADSDHAITQRVALRSPPTSLQVRALPPAPDGYSGAVGQFRLESHVDGAQARSGEPLAWHVTLKGRGNWPQIRGLPPRSAPASFAIAGEARAQQTPGASVFDRELDEVVTLVPREAGRFVLGPVDVLVFEPRRGEYVKLTAPAIELQVAPGANAVTAKLLGADPDAPAVKAAAQSDVASQPLVLPAPMSGQGMAVPPLRQRTWYAWLLAPLAPLAACWLTLALLRLRREDPVWIARRAHRGLQATLARFAQSASVEQRRELLRNWENLVARLLARREAAPVAASFDDTALQRLWSEADLALYSRSGAIPADWAQRARDWWSQQVKPTRDAAQVSWLWRRLVAPAVLLGCVQILGIAVAQAPGEHTLQARVTAEPLDWVARYDLALEHAHAARLAPAAAHAVVAWLQQPRNAATRELWQNLAPRARAAEPRNGGVVRPAELGLAALAPVSTWQWLALALAVCVAGGLACELLFRHGFLQQRVRRTGLGVAAAAMLGLLLAVFATRGYGLAAQPRAVVLIESASLRDVPVEASTVEQQPPLATGTLALVDKVFLGWLRLRCADGRLGWLREQQVLWVWGHEGSK